MNILGSFFTKPQYQYNFIDVVCLVLFLVGICVVFVLGYIGVMWIRNKISLANRRKEYKKRREDMNNYSVYNEYGMLVQSNLSESEARQLVADHPNWKMRQALDE